MVNHGFHGSPCLSRPALSLCGGSSGAPPKQKNESIPAEHKRLFLSTGRPGAATRAHRRLRGRFDRVVIPRQRVVGRVIHDASTRVAEWLLGSAFRVVMAVGGEVLLRISKHVPELVCAVDVIFPPPASHARRPPHPRAPARRCSRRL